MSPTSAVRSWSRPSSTPSSPSTCAAARPCSASIARGGGAPPAALPGPMAELPPRYASESATQFFRLCARALDYCPPVDITFGDFLRAVLTADLDFHPEDPDGVRDALMQAFRLRGIVADEALSYSEASLFWPKVKRGALEVAGLKFGDPNGLTDDEKQQ